MKISLIVCTRNRAPRLPNALDAFSRMRTSGDWQVVIVNNGSTDETQALLERFAARDPAHVVLVQQPIRGLANAQNAGLEHASGEIIAFTDDDCYPEPDYLDRIRECFRESPIHYLGGRVLLHDRNDAPVTITTREARVELPPYTYIPAGIIHGAAFAFRREALEALGGFDPTLGIGSALDSGNDVNALIRCSAMGFRGAFDPRPTVYHHHRRRANEDVDRLLRRYDVARGAAYYLGISNPRLRRAYLWPVVRRLAGNVLKGHWGTLQRELSGGYRYARILRDRARAR